MRASTLCLCMLIVMAKFSCAQKQKLALLSQVHLGVGYVPVLSFKPSPFDYSTNEMARFTIGINYLSGYIKANIQYAEMMPNGLLPGCVMLDNSIAYQYHLSLPKKFTVYGGVQVGLNTIKYEYNNFSIHRIYETELSGATEIGLQKIVWNSLGMHCGYKLMRIYATPRNTLGMVDIGLTYFFNPSQKIKTWLE
jgi:hypothetical protein